jgi:cell division transport system permease protein
MAATGRRVGAGGVSVGARGSRRLGPWLIRHLQSFFYTLGLMSRAPVATVLTTAVIGLALALPAGLYVLLDNVRSATRGWDGITQVSLFLDAAVADAEASALAERLARRGDVAATRVITRAQALQEFRELSGFAEVMDAFADENPLPAVILVEPQRRDGVALEPLLASLGELPEVDFAQFDLAWLQRLHGILVIVERGVLVLSVLLAAGVILVVGNTMRLGIESRRQEIEIVKLFGATNSFIRRPFLYSGLLYGLLGGLLAWLLLELSFAVLSRPVANLVALYGSGYELRGLDGWSGLVLLSGGGLLGLLGSWLSVGRHLSAIEPS